MLRCVAPLLRYQACVGATCVCDLCRVRVLVRLSHPRPSVVTAPTRAVLVGVLWCVVHVVVLSLWRVPSLCLLGSLADPSSTWLRLWSCRSSGKPRTTCGSLHSRSRLTSLAGPSAGFESDTNSSAWADRVGIDSTVNAPTPSAILVSHAHVAVKDRGLISVQLPLVLMLPALLHPTINWRSRPRLAKPAFLWRNALSSKHDFIHFHPNTISSKTLSSNNNFIQ